MLDLATTLAVRRRIRVSSLALVCDCGCLVYLSRYVYIYRVFLDPLSSKSIGVIDPKPSMPPRGKYAIKRLTDAFEVARDRLRYDGGDGEASAGTARGEACEAEA